MNEKKIYCNGAELTLKHYSKPLNQNTGGQSCGVYQTAMRLECVELDLIFQSAHYRSNLKNLDFLIVLMELSIENILGGKVTYQNSDS